MSQNLKARFFRGHVRKTVSPFGVTSWVSELRTPAVGFTSLDGARTVGEALALAIEKAYAPAPVEALAPVEVLAPIHAEPLRQAA